MRSFISRFMASGMKRRRVLVFSRLNLISRAIKEPIHLANEASEL